MYYVYKLIDNRTNEPFYIGKGSGDRKDKHVQKVRLGMVSENRYKDKIIRDIYKETGSYPESVIVAEFDDEDDAYSFETELIKKYGTYKEGGILTNILTENKPPSHKGRKRSAKTIAKLADRCGEKNPMYGRTVSKETKELWKQGRGLPENNPFYRKTGADHSCSKQWEITTPEGKTEIVWSLHNYSKQVGVPSYTIRQNKKGWKCSKIT